MSAGLFLGLAKGINQNLASKKAEEEEQRKNFESSLERMAQDPAMPEQARSEAAKRYLMFTVNPKSIKPKDYQSVIGELWGLTNRPNVAMRQGQAAQQSFDQNWAPAKADASAEIARGEKVLPQAQGMANLLRSAPGQSAVSKAQMGEPMDAEIGPSYTPPQVSGASGLAGMIGASMSPAVQYFQRQASGIADSAKAQSAKGQDDLQTIDAMRSQLMPAGAGNITGLLTKDEQRYEGMQALTDQYRMKQQLEQQFAKPTYQVVNKRLVKINPDGSAQWIESPFDVSETVAYSDPDTQIKTFLDLENKRRQSSGQPPLDPKSEEGVAILNRMVNQTKFTAPQIVAERHRIKKSAMSMPTMTAFIKSQTALSLLETAGRTKNQAADLIAMYAFVKALDPESVVREGEVKLAREAELPILKTIKPLFEAMLNGDAGAMISEKLKRDMIEAMQKQYKTQVNTSYVPYLQSINNDVRATNGLTYLPVLKASDIAMMPSDPTELVSALFSDTRDTHPSILAAQQNAPTVFADHIISLPKPADLGFTENPITGELELARGDQPTTPTEPTAADPTAPGKDGVTRTPGGLPILALPELQAQLGENGQQPSNSQPSRQWPSGIPKPPPEIFTAIQQAAAQEGVDPAILLAIAARENPRYDPALIHPAVTQDSKTPIAEHKRAIGLFGVTPMAASDVGVPADGLTDPLQNSIAAARYYKRMLAQHNNDPYEALGAYNAGAGGWAKQNSPTARQYASNVLRSSQMLSGIGSVAANQTASSAPAAQRRDTGYPPSVQEQLDQLPADVDPNAEGMEVIIELLAEGYSLTQIAEMAGVDSVDMLFTEE